MYFFKDSWFSQLYDKFRNERRCHPDPVVVIHKRKRDDKRPYVKTELRRGGIFWEPPFPEGEDEVSLKKHIEYMQNEWAKSSPDWGKIGKRMVLTFPGRRRMMNTGPPVVDVKSEYPALFCSQEVSF